MGTIERGDIISHEYRNWIIDEVKESVVIARKLPWRNEQERTVELGLVDEGALWFRHTDVKSPAQEIGFSVNAYDRDGDIWDDRIFLHVGDTTRIPFHNIEQLEDFARTILDKVIPEIQEN